MKVLILEPGKVAREAEIEHTLEAMQAVVGGLITATYPYEELVAVVANDEGLLMGLPLNRKLNGYTIIAGTFFICGLSDDGFTDLEPELMNKFKRELYYPHTFVEMPSGMLLAVSYDPNEED